MSWQTYVDEHLMCDIDGNHLTAAAIIGQDGSVWAQSQSFPQVWFSIQSDLVSSWSDLSLRVILIRSRWKWKIKNKNRIWTVLDPIYWNFLDSDLDAFDLFFLLNWHVLFGCEEILCECGGNVL